MKDLIKLIKRADSGDVDVMVEVADYVLWEDMTVSVEEDFFDRAIFYLKKAIEAENTAAMISYGTVFYNGSGA